MPHIITDTNGLIPPTLVDSTNKALYTWSGVEVIDGPECLMPGETGTVVLELSYYDFGPDLYKAVVPGTRFIMAEGPAVIAQGEVLERWESQKRLEIVG
jgi:hypothetical protein